MPEPTLVEHSLLDPALLFAHQAPLVSVGLKQGSPWPWGTWLGFDFGERRVGVAVGESSTGIAHPLATISTTSNDERFRRIALLVQEWQPRAFLVGYPTHLDGQHHAMTRLAEQFGHRLQGRFNRPVVWLDERLSSVAAETMLQAQGLSGRQRKPVLDQMAAHVLLQNFLDAQAASVAAAQRAADVGAD